MGSQYPETGQRDPLFSAALVFNIFIWPALGVAFQAAAFEVKLFEGSYDFVSSCRRERYHGLYSFNGGQERADEIP